MAERIAAGVWGCEGTADGLPNRRGRDDQGFRSHHNQHKPHAASGPTPKVPESQVYHETIRPFVIRVRLSAKEAARSSRVIKTGDYPSFPEVAKTSVTPPCRFRWRDCR